jgi:hypothetical protein
MKLRALVLAAGLLWPVSAFSGGGFKSANDLYTNCLASEASAEYTFCLGYVIGMTDMLAGPPDIVCLTNQVTVRQALDVVMRYLRDHPEDRHYPAASQGFLALKQAFPCK